MAPEPAAGVLASRPPGPVGRPFFGNLFDIVGRDPLVFWQKQCGRYGDAVRLRMGPLDAFLFVHPDAVYEVLVAEAASLAKGVGYRGLRLLLGQGLVTAEGVLWERQRRALQPLFTAGAVNRYAAAMIAACGEALGRWEEAAASDVPMDLGAEMGRMTVRVFGRAVFGTDISAATTLVEAFSRAFAFVSDATANPFALPLVVPTARNRRFRAARRVIDDFVAGLVADAAGRRDDDELLGAVFAALAGNDPKQMRDEIVTLFFAGFETTARTLAWALYLLARHPADLAAVRAEVAAVTGTRGLTPDHLPHLKTTAQVIAETLRLYPPTALLARQATRRVRVGGYDVPARSLVVLSPHLTHRHPAFWDEPEAFRPGRSIAPHRAAYVPFGLGPRICLGKHFALVEAVAALAMVAARYEWTMLDPAPVGMSFHGTTWPDRPLLARVTRRVRDAA